jgi:DNA-binding NarL/FixJ family response regulator
MTPNRVLVVEDNATTAVFVCQQLSHGGLVPETVRDGLEALRKAHAQAFALAVVDVDITSEPDGVETADWLSRLYGIPVIVFSMTGDRDIRHRAAVAGSAGFVVRPEAAGELWSVASNVLSAVLSRRTSRQVVTNAGHGSPEYRGQDRPAESPSARSRQAPDVPADGSAMPAGFAELSGREWQIIRDLIATPSAQAVALKRQRSRHTVHNHLKSIFRKLQVHSVAELLSLMIRLSRQVPIL